MDNENGQEWHEWYTAKGVPDYEDVMSDMMGNILSEGYYPYDFNWAGYPNVYMRGRYNYDNGVWGELIETGFLVFVRQIES